MRITVKVLKLGKTFDVEVEPRDSGRSLVQKVASELSVAPELVRIIANMTILKEAQSIEENKITDGSTVQVTVKNAQPIQVKETVLPQVSVGQEKPQAQPAAASGAQVPGGIPDMMTMMRNPEMMKQMMQNPMIQSMYDNPELMRQMMQNNPLIQKMIQQHPELEDAFNDPAALQMMRDMRDPAKLDEILRQQDQAIANLQNVPGGMEMLQKYQQDLGSLMDEEITGGQKQTGDWFLPDPQPQQSAAKAQEKPAANAVEDADMPLPKSYLQMIKAVPSTRPSATPSVFSGQPSRPQQPAMQPSSFGGMPGIPGMDNPAALQEMMNNPMMQQMMDQMADNPAMFQAYMNNPMVRQQLQAMTGNNPMVDYLFQNPEMLRQQFKMAREMMRSGQMPPGFPSAPQATPQAQPPRTAGPTQEQAAQQTAMRMQGLQALKTKWASQLELIRGLGIQADEATVLQLLEICNGNVEQVVNQLFEGQ